jgi:hypothetical protein
MHPWRRTVMAVLGGALVLSGSVPVVLSVFAGGADQAAALNLDQEHGQPPDDQTRDDDAGRHGPPPWAQVHGTKSQEKSLTQWKAMGPAQRRATMDRLVHEHAAGMTKFSACVAAGRQHCVKPLPPGLAKRG